MQKKILLFHTTIKSSGGIERLIYEFYNRSKNKITIFTLFYIPNEVFKDLKVIYLFNEKLKALAKAFLLRAIPLLLGSFVNIEYIFKKYKYDILLLSTAGMGELILLRNKLRNYLKIAYVHTILRDSYIYDYYWNMKYSFKDSRYIQKLLYKLAFIIYNKLEKIAWKNIDFAIFNSELSRKRALDKNLIKIEKTSVIYPGVNLNDFYNSKPKDYFLYVARFHRRKRQDVLIRAFELFSKEFKDYKLYLVGGLEQKKYYYRILNYIKEKDLIGKVIVKTDVKDKELKRLYSECLAFVHVPFMEDFGIAPLEAAASGKFIINTYPSGNYEILKNFPGIYWIKEKFDNKKMIEEIYKALVYFTRNKDKLIEDGLKNKQIIKELDLSWDRFAKEIDTLINNFRINKNKNNNIK